MACDLSPGIYCARIYDNCGLEIQECFEVLSLEPPLFHITSKEIIHDKLCNGQALGVGSITLDFNNILLQFDEVQYTWEGPNNYSSNGAQLRFGTPKFTRNLNFL